MKGFARATWLLSLGMAVVFLDFLTKAYIYYLLPLVNYVPVAYPYGGIGIFRNFLGIEGSISLAINRGAAWGVFSEFQFLLLIIRILVILGMILYLIFVNQRRAVDVPFILIIAGAIGNVIDFFLYGYVIDFIHFRFWGYSFPVFNLADMAITVGVVWLFFVAIFSKGKRKIA